MITTGFLLAPRPGTGKSIISWKRRHLTGIGLLMASPLFGLGLSLLGLAPLWVR